MFDISRSLLHTPCNCNVDAEPPAEHKASVPNMSWKLCKVVYGLEEAMVEFDSYFEEVACGRTGPPSEEGLRMKRLVSEPGAYYDASLDTAISKHVNDGIITALGDN